MQRTVSSTVTVAQSERPRKMTAWPPLTEQDLLWRQIQWTLLVGKRIQAQGWDCLAVHSKGGERSCAADSYAIDASHLHEAPYNCLNAVIHP